MPPHGVAALLSPQNVVLVGASERPGHWSKRIFTNLTRFGYPGRVYAVNPGHQTIWGMPCYAAIEALPEPPDHLALFVPAESAVEILEQAARRGARSATIFAAGFGEGGAPLGKALAARLKALVNDTGLAVVGPNCIGVACGHSRFVTMADEQISQLKPGPVAIATQSGMLASSINRAVTERDLAIGYLISAGNQACLTFADYIAHFAEDPDVRVILCYIETILDRDRFLAAAEHARARGKAIVAVKIGGSDASRSAALAHTGNIAGQLDVFQAYARDVGIIPVTSLDEMIEAAEYLARTPRPAGPSIAVLTNSGAAKSLITEAAGRHAIQLADLAPPTVQRLRSVLGEEADVSNPLDTKITIPADRYMGCIAALAEAPEVDLLVTIEELPRDTGVARKVTNMTSLNAYCAQTSPGRSPVAVLAPMHVSETPYMRDLRAGLPSLSFMRGLESGLGALSAIARRSRAAGPLPDLTPSPEVLASLQARSKGITEPLALSEATSKQLLAEFGIATPRERIAPSPEAAAMAAPQLGFPVVVKAMASGLAHKTEAGMVILNLDSPAGVQAAAHTIAARARQHGVTLDGYLVAEQLTGGLEVLVGMHRDPEMGPALMITPGGILAELIADPLIMTLAVDRPAIREALAPTRLATLLGGYRGSGHHDLDALADTVVALACMTKAFGDRLQSVEINPLLVRPGTGGAVALDALVVLHPAA